MDELEREIERAFVVDPSPDFVARVRTRIAREPIASPWLATSRLVGTVCAMGILAIAVSWQRYQPLITPIGGMSQLTTRAIASKFTMSPPSVTPSRLPQQLPATARRVDRPPAIVRVEPEVLIAHGEAAALNRLLRGEYQQSLVEPPADRRTARVALDPPRMIEVSPVAEIAIINIEPLRFAADHGGIRQ